MIRRIVLLAGLLVVSGADGAVAAGTPPVPIPSTNFPPGPTYVGHPATVDAVRNIPLTPRNPFMAPNGKSEIHDDGWQTDVNRWGGPLGRKPQTLSSDLNRDCGSITFDSKGRVVSICIGVSGPELYMFDPKTLATLATFMLPPRQSVPNNIFQDFTGGGYFYLDNHDRVVAATTTRHIYVIKETPGPGFALVHDYDLSKVLNSNEKITSALPDSNGLLWVVARTDGVVLTLNFKTGKIHFVRLGHGSNGEIENSFATDQHGGVYIDTNHKLYRFGAGPNGVPKIVWSVKYPNSGESKPGQVDNGTGTTPTVMPGGYVNITDNADPMDIVVYRTAVHPHIRLCKAAFGSPGSCFKQPVSRQACKVPIFSKGHSADENSIITAGDSMIAEDNYGYQNPSSVQGKTTAPGFVRVDLTPDGCHRVWLNTKLAAPTVVSKAALANGLVYSYTTDSNGHWYWTALNFRTGQLVYKVYAGTGLGYNNNYSGISIDPADREFVGTLGGIIELRDGVRTAQPPPPVVACHCPKRPAHHHHSHPRHRRGHAPRRPRRHHGRGFTG